jgi:hypothetical protein
MSHDPRIDHSTVIAPGQYGPMQVLQSAAGYYVGTLFREEFGNVPGSRDSGYFETFEAAKSYLDYVTA